MSKQQKQMRRWSDAKLDMELSFAVSMTDENDPNAVLWRENIKFEVARREGDHHES